MSAAAALAAMFPPPLAVQRRGWEAAYVLRQDYRARLARPESERMAWVVARQPERLTWDDIREALALYRAHVAVRQ